MAQTELRDLLCQKEFNDILENRDEYSKMITSKVESKSKDWGVNVEHVQLKNIDLTNENMVRAMAKEAEATREKMAAMIRADGEYRAAIKLTKAAEILESDPVAVELRRLQTLERIAKEKNQTTLVVPMNIFNSIKNVKNGNETRKLTKEQLDKLEQELKDTEQADARSHRPQFTQNKNENTNDNKDDTTSSNPTN